jgi:hypothetical protein
MSTPQNQRKVGIRPELRLAAKPGVFCEEKVLLVANYGAAASEYFASVSQLERGMIRASREKYAELRRSVETARMRCEAALKELDDHVSADGC